MQAGVVKQVRTPAMARAKRARAHVVLLTALIAAVVLAYVYRGELFGLDLPIRIACVVALVILGWAFAMNLGRAAGPMLMKRVEPGTAGTIGFLIRLGHARPDRAGGAPARRPRAGDAGRGRRHHRRHPRPRRAADGRQPDRRHPPPQRAPVPGGRPDPRARPPSEVDRVLREDVSVETRSEPRVEVEEMDGEHVIFRVRATPADSGDGPELADEVVAALDKLSNDRHDG